DVCSSDLLARERHEVRAPFLQDLLGLAGMDDHAHRHGLHAGFRPEPLGIRHLVAVARRRARAGAAEYAAAAAVDDVDALAREFARERDAVLESPARAVDGRQAHE